VTGSHQQREQQSLERERRLGRDEQGTLRQTIRHGTAQDREEQDR